MLTSTSGWNFFVLSSDYKKILLDEIYFLIRRGNFQYSDIINMPTYERKYFIGKIIEEIDITNQENEKR